MAHGSAAPPPTPINGSMHLFTHNSAMNEEALIALFLQHSLPIPHLSPQPLQVRRRKGSIQRKSSLPQVSLSAQEEDLAKELAKVASENGAFGLVGCDNSLNSAMQLESYVKHLDFEKKPLVAFNLLDNDAIQSIASELGTDDDRRIFSGLLCEYIEAMEVLAKELLQKLLQGFQIDDEERRNKRTASAISFSIKSEMGDLMHSPGDHILSIHYLCGSINYDDALEKEPKWLIVTMGDVLKAWTEGQLRSPQDSISDFNPTLVITFSLVLVKDQE